jgi:large subunit ribosomal protein L17
MPKPKKGPHFGGSASHHHRIVGNLATELFRHGRVQTTLPKAKQVQPLAERMVTFAKRGDLHARRQVTRVIQDRDVVHKLFADVGPAFVGRHGGYTRVLKTGSRKGDRAPMALIELVEASRDERSAALGEAPRRRWSLRRRRGTVSHSAREREEQEAAAEDRGETVGGEADEDVGARREDRAAEPDPTGLDPGEIERRLAAQEAADADTTAEADGAGDNEAEDADADTTAEADGAGDNEAEAATGDDAGGGDAGDEDAGGGRGGDAAS